ncbi:hypothetical protein ACIQCD_16415 [Streptomyces sp. NPDC093250]|uniref:hypothetical protein n=1 Tax=Streptomyces sp. NPDC093250 TaxID=3366036 RepID=UPI003823CDFE
MNQGGNEHRHQRRVLIVAYDDAQILDIACPSGALDIANRYDAQPPYAIELGILGRRAARSSAGILLAAGQSLEAVVGRLDTLIVVGVGCEDAAADERLLGQVRRLAAHSRTGQFANFHDLLNARLLTGGHIRS